MKVKFILRDGQTITAEFPNDLEHLEDSLSRALGETDSTSVATLKAKNGRIFLVRMPDVMLIEIHS